MKPTREVGLVGYGAYVPRFRIPATEIARVWDGIEDNGVPIESKSVPGPDEDVATMSIEAAQNALLRAGIAPTDVGAVWVGTESKPYAVKPTSTIVAEALGIGPFTQAADWEFACKAGSEALQAAFGMVGSGMLSYAMALGMDTAQGRPGDALEYTAGAGGAALIVGLAEESLAVLEASTSYVTDTPDFFRRQHQHYPQHGHRFTGKPAYFHHVLNASQNLLDELGQTPADYEYVVFHQPNVKFPLKATRALGFSRDQVMTGLLSNRIGNTYAGAALIGLTAVLDEAKPGDKVFVCTFGSGAGSDAFSFVMTDMIEERRTRARSTQMYVERNTTIDYATYGRYRKKFVMN
ncbi:MAG: Hydroxymethylglutaryl-CoA synthase [Anaerolineales bacterium]|nr:Hydroxymethylglutaryl-CoA synthase [Anaerolineales bacterium]